MKLPKVSKEVKVGIMTAVGIIIAIFGISYLKGSNLLVSTRTFYARYQQADGIGNSAAVMLHGVKVGQVKKVEVANGTNLPVMIKFSINKGVLVPVNSIARVVNTDLLGSKALELVQGNSPILSDGNDTLKGEVSLGMLSSLGDQVTPVTKRVEKLLATIDTVILNVNTLFNKQVKGDLTATISSLKATMEHFDKFSSDLNNEYNPRFQSILGHVDHIVNSLDKNGPLIDKAVANFAQMSDTLKALEISKTIRNANNALATVNTMLDKVNKGEGSLGMFLKDNRIYDNLQASSKDLDNLILDIKENPKRYLNISVITIDRTKKDPKKEQVK